MVVGEPFTGNPSQRCSNRSPPDRPARRSSEILRTSPALLPALVHLVQCRSRGSDLALFDLAVAQRQNLEQCQSLLGLFVALDILPHKPRLAVLGGDHRRISAFVRPLGGA